MQEEQTVTTPNGTVKRIVAPGGKDDLREAVKAAQNEPEVVTPDINVPVRKGHDMLAVGADGVTQGLTDATGAHNSPRDAVRDDGTVEGQAEVPVLVQERNTGTATATTDNLQKLGKDGKLTDYTAKDAQKADEATSVAPEAPAAVAPANGATGSSKS